MKWLKMPLIAIITALVMAGYPQSSAQAEDTSTQFLSWTPTSQESFLNTSVLMATYIASRDSKSKAECVRDWYFNNREGRRIEVVQKVREYSDHHPTAIVLALLQTQCGNL